MLYARFNSFYTRFHMFLDAFRPYYRIFHIRSLIPESPKTRIFLYIIHLIAIPAPCGAGDNLTSYLWCWHGEVPHGGMIPCRSPHGGLPQ